MHLRSVPPGIKRDAYLPLLRLADDSEAQIRSYYQTGDLYAFDDESPQTLGMVLVIPRAMGEAELKAVAIEPAHQGRGIGQQMIKALLAELHRAGLSRVIVGTGNCAIGQLAFYQKLGFRLFTIERDFFSEERGYPNGILENGIPLRDMVWMDLQLPCHP